MKRHRTTRARGPVVLALGLLLASCSGDDTEPATSAAAETTPSDEGAETTVGTTSTSESEPADEIAVRLPFDPCTAPVDAALVEVEGMPSDFALGVDDWVPMSSGAAHGVVGCKWYTPDGSLLVIGALTFDDAAAASQEWYDTLIELAGFAPDQITDVSDRLPGPAHLARMDEMATIGVFGAEAPFTVGFARKGADGVFVPDEDLTFRLAERLIERLRPVDGGVEPPPGLLEMGSGFVLVSRGLCMDDRRGRRFVSLVA